MREARHAAWQFVFVCLLAWPCCQASVTSPAGAGCNSEHLTVSAAAGSPVAGCYWKTDGSVGENGGLLYINTNGGAVDGGVGRTVAMWSLDNRASDSRWAIGEVHGKHASRICVSGSPMQGWECAGGAVIQNMVTCGCDQEVAGKFGAGGGGGEKLGGRIRGGRSNTRHSVRGADGRDEGAVFAAAADGGAVVSRALSDGGDFHSFWKWVVVAFGIAGLIVLCLIGWYIRNPFFCQKEPPAPPADPTVVRDDVAPQAPKVAFQPWGASAPPK